MRFFIAFAVALLMTPVFARVGVALGFVDRPDGTLKPHATDLPLSGGVAVIAAVFAALALRGGWIKPSIIAAVALAATVGLLDDRLSLSPWIRVAVQGLAALALALAGFRLDPLGPLAVPGFVLLVVACANAVNLVDGQDGMAGGLAAIAAVGFAALGTHLHDPHLRAIGLASAGALVGFLVWNRAPARVFLGNGGAYAVGVLLAIATARLVSLHDWHGLLAAGMCMAVFAFELVATTVRRIYAGLRPSEGDRNHSYDLLAGGLVDVRTTSAVFWALGAVAAGLSLAVIDAPLWLAAPLLAVLTGLVALAGTRIWRGTGGVRVSLLRLPFRAR
jgi:UDP-GlcNAc:undecaprenyl-phosphate/decaprenyl-phosphate GlcNAc-1-phosphate transferase